VAAQFTRRIAAVMVILVLSSDGVLAEPPADRAMEYSIRETPTDPESAVLYVIRLELTPISISGDTISWKIAAAEITKSGAGGSGDIVWFDDSPTLATSNGYWNVTHADPSDPEDVEFNWPPLLIGTALPDDPNEENLNYDFSGDTCDSECLQLFGGFVAGIVYEFQLESRQLMLAEGDDEPVEINGDDLDP